MKRRFIATLFLLATFTGSLALLGFQGCKSSGNGTGSTLSSYSRTLTSLNTATSTVTNSCTLVSRDTSSCQTARTALGLSGNWLKFSCNVTLGLADASGNSTTNYAAATYVTVTFVDLPDYSSNYYVSGTYSFTANSSSVGGSFSSLSNTYSPSYPNPSNIAQQSITMNIPITPSHWTTTQAMDLGQIGVSINGVALYSNLASGSDSIYTEESSFDQCKGHPSSENGGTYHYHSEPYSISYNDNNLIGVMRDGYFIFGRKDYNGTDVSATWTSSTNLASSTGTDMLYIYGGHTGVDPQLGTGSSFHYHLTQFTGCVHYSGSNSGSSNTLVHYPDDGSTTCFCTGSNVGSVLTAYFLTGHGAGGTYSTPSTASVSNGSDTCTTGGTTYTTTLQSSTSGTRYYYGTPGTCSGCN